MYEILKIGVVAEGPTDVIVIKDIVANLCGDREFVITTLQPECSVAFEQYNGMTGTGWSGVCRWIHVLKEQTNKFSDNPLWNNFPIIILHLDTDTIDQTYKKGRLGHLTDVYGNLPYQGNKHCGIKKSERCQNTCDLSRERVNALRKILCGWIGEHVPDNLIFCTPVESTDAWVLAAFFPNNNLIKNGQLECRLGTFRILETQKREKRIKKTTSDYLEKVAEKFQQRWSQVCQLSFEASRFSDDLMKAISTK